MNTNIINQESLGGLSNQTLLLQLELLSRSGAQSLWQGLNVGQIRGELLRRLESAKEVQKSTGA